jgi:hypothetical protein
MMSRVRHPGIAAVYGLAAGDMLDHGGGNQGQQQRGGVALVMRYYRRGPVSSLLNTLAWSDVGETQRLRMALQV